MTAKEYMDKVVAENGTQFAGAVMLAANACALTGMISTCQMNASERDEVLEAFTSFASASLAGLVGALGASHESVGASAVVFLDLAKAESLGVMSMSRDAIARAARH